MCFHLTCSKPGQPTILGVDMRHSAYLKTGGAIRGDYGGKMHRFGSGWVALGGHKRPYQECGQYRRYQVERDRNASDYQLY
jgi:hypothetical protein